MTSTLPPLVQAFTGALGSASSNVMTYPLDIAATRAQLYSHSNKKPGKTLDASKSLNIIIRRAKIHGLRSLYTGLVPDTIAGVLSNFFYFYFYSFLRTLVLSRKPRAKGKVANLTLFTEIGLGFVAGVASRLISTPLNIVTVRLQANSENDDSSDSEDEKDVSDNVSITDKIKNMKMISILQEIYEKEGLAGFWRGFGTTILLSLNPSITFAFFQIFRRLLGRGGIANPTPRQAALGGAVANSIALTILYPFILAKTRQQVEGSDADSDLESVLTNAYTGHVPPSATSTNTERARVKGVRGLYQGLQMKILKGFLSQGVTFLVKGRIEQLIISAYIRSRKA